jgi:hypothetical protein
MNRQVAALWCLGLALRLAALPLPGTGDVSIWKTWSVSTVASGVTAIYGVGGHPPNRAEHRSIAGGSQRFPVDYPPLSLYTLQAVGWAYRAVFPEMRDTAAFTVMVKLPPLLAEMALAWLVFSMVRRWKDRQQAELAALACWLNPALMLNGSALGYLDMPFVLPAVAALLAAAAGRTWLTGMLFAASALCKAQGVLLAPVIGLAVVTFGKPTARRAELVALRLGETAAGAAIVTVAALAPFARAGTLSNLVAGVRSLAEHDMLSGNAANLWWIVTWWVRGFDALPDVGAWRAFTEPPRILAISVVEGLGYPNARAVGLVLMAAAWLWAIWHGRRTRDPWMTAGLGAFLVHAYFALAAQVHENHLLLAIPLAVVASIGRPRWRGVALALTAIQFLNLNLFYGFSEAISPNLAIPRSITGVDAAVVLSLVNLATLGWHGSVLLAESRLSAEEAGAETTL